MQFASKFTLILVVSLLLPKAMGQNGKCYADECCSKLLVAQSQTEANCKLLKGNSWLKNGQNGKDICTFFAAKGICHEDKICGNKIIDRPIEFDDDGNPFTRATIIPKTCCGKIKDKNGKPGMSWLPVPFTDVKKDCCVLKKGNGVDDPHFKTWSGKTFNFMAACDLVMLHAKQIGLDLHLRTKIRSDYSFIESAALRIGNDVLEVSSWGDYFLNGVSGAKLPFALDGRYQVSLLYADEKEHVLDVQLDDDQHIFLSTLKNFVRVEIQVDSVEQFGDSQGLMGYFTAGGWLARNGTTVLEDPDMFGQEWQVLATEPKLFVVADRAPQHPQKCIFPQPKEEVVPSRRLGGGAISKQTAEKACAHWADNKADCISDVMATGDLDMAKEPFMN